MDTQISDFSFPKGFSERLKIMLGSDYPLFEAAYSKPRRTALRPNRLKVENADISRLLDEISSLCRLSHVEWADDGYYLDHDGNSTEEFRPGAHPMHDAGAYYIQEASAMVSACLDPAKEGERVLDLCAAPGGKTTQIAMYLRGTGLLVSNEINASRAAVLSENVERMGIRNAIVTSEPPARLAERFPAFFDRIIVDAPCSGEGMFRKEEAALTQWSEEYLRVCAERQAKILDCAARMLRPGGRIIYSTCTFAPEENEGCISAFVARHSEFSVVSPTRKSSAFSSGNPDWVRRFCDAEPCVGIENTVRLWPHVADAEGHFAAVLQKDSSAGDIRPSVKKDKKSRRSSDSSSSSNSLRAIENAKKLFADFAKSELSNDKEFVGNPVLFGDTLYLLPEGLSPDELDGLRVLRAGLWLGTVKGNRFEPSHALALALLPSDAKSSYALDDASARKYIHGDTLPADGLAKGWLLLSLRGVTIGWGKVSDGIIKNHYPKGLRR